MCSFTKEGWPFPDERLCSNPVLTYALPALSSFLYHGFKSTLFLKVRDNRGRNIQTPFLTLRQRPSTKPTCQPLLRIITPSPQDINPQAHLDIQDAPEAQAIAMSCCGRHQTRGSWLEKELSWTGTTDSRIESVSIYFCSAHLSHLA